jgi:hypothetical protein
MSDHDIQRHWKVEVHQRLQDGATSLRLKDIEDETGVSVQSRTDAARLWRELWQHLEAMGLVRNVHHSAREPDCVDRVMLTDWGSDPANWDD